MTLEIQKPGYIGQSVENIRVCASNGAARIFVWGGGQHFRDRPQPTTVVAEIFRDPRSQPGSVIAETTFGALIFLMSSP